MKSRLATSAAVTLILAATGTAFADHNSKNGEGWANMPNDVHNTRIETKEADDNEAFRDFVKYGEGSRTENRFDTDSSDPTQAGSKQNMAKKQDPQQNMANKQEQQQNMAKKQEQKRVDTNSATQTKSRTEDRSRQRLDTRSMSRSSRSTATRSSRGGRKN